MMAAGASCDSQRKELSWCGPARAPETEGTWTWAHNALVVAFPECYVRAGAELVLAEPVRRSRRRIRGEEPDRRAT